MSTCSSVDWIISPDGPADDPARLADATDPLEPLALEHGDRAVVQERGRDGPSVDLVGIALDRPATEPRDRPERPGQPRGRHTQAAVAAVDEEARDPPVGQLVEAVEVGAPVLDP